MLQENQQHSLDFHLGEGSWEKSKTRPQNAARLVSRCVAIRKQFVIACVYCDDKNTYTTGIIPNCVFLIVLPLKFSFQPLQRRVCCWPLLTQRASLDKVGTNQNAKCQVFSIFWEGPTTPRPRPTRASQCGKHSLSADVHGIHVAKRQVMERKVICREFFGCSWYCSFSTSFCLILFGVLGEGLP